MSLADDLHSWTVSTLSARCAEESARFFSALVNETRYCFELFRRAFADRSERAWQEIYDQYEDLAVRWVHRHPAFSSIDEDAHVFVNSAFTKMWRAISPEKFGAFSRLSEVLRYLKMCIGSVLTDYVRKRNETLALSALPPAAERARNVDVERDAARNSDRSQFWQLIVARLKDEREIAVVHDAFALGLKPRQILENRPGLFADVREIYRVKENVLDRLRRDAELQTLLSDFA